MAEHTQNAPHKHKCLRCGEEFICRSPGVCTAQYAVLPSIVVMGPKGPEVREHCRQVWVPNPEFKTERKYAVMGWSVPALFDGPRFNAAEEVLPYGVWDVGNDLLLCACPDEEVAQRIADALEAVPVADQPENER